MTVDELIKKLEDFDGDMKVVISDDNFDFAIESVADNGFDTVWINAGDKTEDE